MATKKKLLQAAAGSAGGAGLNVEEVFSTYLLDGSGTITNGIDLAGEGGLLWTKWRSGGALSFYQNHFLYDTERGYGSTDYLHSNNTDAAGATGAIGSGSFNSDGFTTGGNVFSGNEWASWTFRKAPKFFDVVTYTGAAFVDQTVSHNLGSVPGMIIIKCTSSARNWVVYHRSLGNTKHLHLNTTDAESTVNYFNNTDPTDTTFTVEGGDSDVNGYNETYVAYLFAHNNGDGDFGPTGDQDIIKCGSFTDSGSSSTPTDVNLGFEPQWLLVKASSTSSDWYLLDMMREMSLNDGRHLRPNLSNAETNFSVGYFKPTPTGFQFRGDFFGSGQTAIYIAIRRGPMAVPTAATDVFDVNTYANNSNSNIYDTGFNADMNINTDASANESNYILDRLRGGSYLKTNDSGADVSTALTFWDNGNNLLDLSTSWWGTTSGVVSWSWRRAPNYFDVVAYTGNGTAGRTVSHNLGVAPEMMWVKDRDDAEDWSVYHAGITNPEQNYLYLNSSSALNPNSNTIRYWNHTAPTDSVFTLGDEGRVNQSGENYIAYLFASLDGVSKVGSYTGDGTTDGSKVIDCGFSSGARFVLIKRTDGGGSWYVWDSERGIVAGNDPRLKLESTDAEASFDNVDPHSSGFSVVGSSINNINGANYIFYAIA